MFGVTGRTPATDERGEAKAASGARAPREGVEKTPEGSAAELAVLKVLVETQNEDPVASEVPFMPLSIASDIVIAVAGFVVGLVGGAAFATSTDDAPKAPSTSAESANAKSNLPEFVDSVFCIRIIN